MKLKVKNVSGRKIVLPGGVKAFVGREIEVEDSSEIRGLINAKILELVWDEQAEKDAEAAKAEAAALDEAERRAEPAEQPKEEESEHHVG